MNQVTAKQHSVPKFYLKRFADSKGFLQVFDVKNQKLLSPRPYSSVCYEQFYYAAQTGEPDDSSQLMEKLLHQYEDFVSTPLPGIITRILSNAHIEEIDRWVLSVLISMLWVRSPVMRRQINRLHGQMRKEIMSLFAKERVDHFVTDTSTSLSEAQKADLVKWLKNGDYDIDFDNVHHLKFLLDSLDPQKSEFMKLLYAQDWRIYLAKGVLKFITSDSPVVEWSGQSRSPFEAKTFLQRSHYLALTPEILLELTCPSGSISKIRRKTLYADQDDTVKKYNFLIAAHVFQYAYASDAHSIEELLEALRRPDRE